MVKPCQAEAFVQSAFVAFSVGDWQIPPLQSLLSTYTLTALLVFDSGVVHPAVSLGGCICSARTLESCLEEARRLLDSTLADAHANTPKNAAENDFKPCNVQDTRREGPAWEAEHPQARARALLALVLLLQRVISATSMRSWLITARTPSSFLDLQGLQVERSRLFPFLPPVKSRPQIARR
jgi:hypothetical protein